MKNYQKIIEELKITENHIKAKRARLAFYARAAGQLSTDYAALEEVQYMLEQAINFSKEIKRLEAHKKELQAEMLKLEA